MKETYKKQLSDIYKLAHKYNFDDFCQFMPLSQPLSRERVIEARDEVIQKLTEPNKSIDNYRCYWEGRKSLADELYSDAGQREEKCESDQSNLISKYEELAEIANNHIPYSVRSSREYAQLESDIAALKTKTE